MSAPRFAPAQRVRVRADYPPGHVRTPYYTRGRTGTIESIAGCDPDPEALAYGRRDGAPVVLYRVRFSQEELWPGYRGPAADCVHVDIFETWLEPIDGR